MKRHRIIYFFAVLIGIAFLSAADFAFAQQGIRPAKSVGAPSEKPRRVGRMSFFRELDLSDEQIAQIRQIYATGRPVMKKAQQRLRDAGRALDRAIYADVLDEGAVRLLLEEEKAAQAEVLRLKYLGELEVRKVLSPIQLAKFRKIRMRFEERRKKRAHDASKRHVERKRTDKP